MNWQHDELANDLASHLLDAQRRMVWTNLQLGPRHSARPDVYTMDKSFVHPNPRAYEVKVSVADFRSDVTTGKWQNYLAYAQAVTFAVPHGLVPKSDIPAGCGFMVRSERGWATIRKPTLSVLDRIPEEALLKLLIDGCERERRAYRVEQTSRWYERDRIKQELGADVAEALDRRDALLRDAEITREKAQHELRDAEATVERRIKDTVRVAREVTGEVRQALGIDENVKDWNLSFRVSERLRRLDRDGEVAHLRRQIDAIRKALAEAEVNWPATEDNAA